eukprot:scaffold672984_cov27-Prasinocladus_malaysianus.AAC.1
MPAWSSAELTAAGIHKGGDRSEEDTPRQQIVASSSKGDDGLAVLAGLLADAEEEAISKGNPAGLAAGDSGRSLGDDTPFAYWPGMSIRDQLAAARAEAAGLAEDNVDGVGQRSDSFEYEYELGG